MAHDYWLLIVAIVISFLFLPTLNLTTRCKSDWCTHETLKTLSLLRPVLSVFEKRPCRSLHHTSIAFIFAAFWTLPKMLKSDWSNKLPFSSAPANSSSSSTRISKSNQQVFIIRIDLKTLPELYSPVEHVWHASCTSRNDIWLWSDATAFVHEHSTWWNTCSCVKDIFQSAALAFMNENSLMERCLAWEAFPIQFIWAKTHISKARPVCKGKLDGHFLLALPSCFFIVLPKTQASKQ